MDLGRTCTWFRMWILNVKLQSFRFHVALGNSVHLSSFSRNSHAIQSPGLCERSTGNIWNDKGQSQLQTLYSLGFRRELCHSSQAKNIFFWYFNGLIMNKRIEEWAKFLWKVNCCFSGRIPENQLKRSPQPLLHIVELNPSRFSIVLNFFLFLGGKIYVSFTLNEHKRWRNCRTGTGDTPLIVPNKTRSVVITKRV